MMIVLLIIFVPVGVVVTAIAGAIGFLYYAYDTTEMVKISTHDRPLVAAFYGHTSFLDMFIGIIHNEKLPRPSRMLMKFPYPNILPQWIRNRIVLIEPGKSNIDAVLGYKGEVISMWIEGARNKLPYVRSGFYHVAMAMEADIAICFLNHHDRKFYVKVVPYGEYTKETILPMFSEFIGERNHAIYPKSVSCLEWRSAE
jgi:hypothetical protein